MLKALFLTAAIVAPIGTVTIPPQFRAFQQPNVSAPPASVPARAAQAPAPASPTPAAGTFARELMDAPNDEARRTLLDARSSLVTIDLTRALLEEGTRLLQKGTLDRALVAYRLARLVAERAHEPMGVAGASSRIAQTLSAIGEYDEALELLRESEAIYRERKETRSELHGHSPPSR